MTTESTHRHYFRQAYLEIECTDDTFVMALSDVGSCECGMLLDMNNGDRFTPVAAVRQWVGATIQGRGRA